MDKRILKAVELVIELNRKGEELNFDMTPSQLVVRDKKQGFKSVIQNVAEFDIIYFNEWFDKLYDSHMDLLIQELERRMEIL